MRFLGVDRGVPFQGQISGQRWQIPKKALSERERHIRDRKYFSPRGGP